VCDEFGLCPDNAMAANAADAVVEPVDDHAPGTIVINMSERALAQR